MPYPNAPPALSVVLVTPDGYDAVAATAEAWAAERGAEQLELVLVAPGGSEARFPPSVEEAVRSAAVLHLPTPAVVSVPQARALGVRSARADHRLLGGARGAGARDPPGVPRRVRGGLGCSRTRDARRQPAHGD